MADARPEHHDWDKQYRETAWVWKDLQSKGVDFSKHYRLDLQFISAAEPSDRDAFAAALQAAGYEVRFYSVDPTVEATTAPMLLTVEAVWQHEKQATEIALLQGYKPDGWGFWSGDNG